MSTDDGYASTKGRDEVLATGVKNISISGAKGKRLTDPDDWQSDVYRNARRERSAVDKAIPNSAATQNREPGTPHSKTFSNGV